LELQPLHLGDINNWLSLPGTSELPKILLRIKNRCIYRPSVSKLTLPTRNLHHPQSPGGWAMKTFTRFVASDTHTLQRPDGTDWRFWEQADVSRLECGINASYVRVSADQFPVPTSRTCRRFDVTFNLNLNSSVASPQLHPRITRIDMPKATTEPKANKRANPVGNAKPKLLKSGKGDGSPERYVLRPPQPCHSFISTLQPNRNKNPRRKDSARPRSRECSEHYPSRLASRGPSRAPCSRRRG
ncbi:hypothetical protein DFP72DRAFT_54822, partial [Ephemerocybe angulata]